MEREGKECAEIDSMVEEFRAMSLQDHSPLSIVRQDRITSTKGFLDLPGEIRNIIYLYLIRADPWEDLDDKGRPRFRPRWSDPMVHPIRKAEDWCKRLPPMGRVSQVIRREILSLYFSKARFDVMLSEPYNFAFEEAWDIDQTIYWPMARYYPHIRCIKVFNQSFRTAMQFSLMPGKEGDIFELVGFGITKRMCGIAHFVKETTERYLQWNSGPWTGAHLIDLIGVIDREVMKFPALHFAELTCDPVDFKYSELIARERVLCWRSSGFGG